MILQMCLFLDLRKKVLDFYQRNSMSAYCVAFSYRPVTEQIPDEKSEDVYLELPSTAQWICSESDEMERTALSFLKLMWKQHLC